jgi:hypothetical protein
LNTAARSIQQEQERRKKSKSKITGNPKNSRRKNSNFIVREPPEIKRANFKI